MALRFITSKLALMKLLRTYGMLSLLFLCCLPAISQTTNVTIKGNVKSSENSQSVPSVTVTIKGTQEATFTDEKGNFYMTTQKKPAFNPVYYCRWF